MATLRLAHDLGHTARIENVAGFVGDVNTVCQFGIELQRRADRSLAVYQVLRSWPRYIPERDDLDDEFASPYIPWRVSLGISELAVSPAFEAAVATQLQRSEAGSRWEVRVEYLSYRNPVELVILASGAVVIAVLRLVRDWPARRRLNESIADDYESTVQTRNRIREHVLDELASGQMHLRADQVEALLTPEVGGALKALGDSAVRVERLDQEGEMRDPW